MQQRLSAKPFAWEFNFAIMLFALGAIAQWQSGGLISPRSLVQIQLAPQLARFLPGLFVSASYAFADPDIPK